MGPPSRNGFSSTSFCNFGAPGPSGYWLSKPVRRGLIPDISGESTTARQVRGLEGALKLVRNLLQQHDITSGLIGLESAATIETTMVIGDSPMSAHWSSLATQPCPPSPWVSVQAPEEQPPEA